MKFCEMTLDDCDLVIEPWVMPTRILRMVDGTLIPEPGHCEVYEEGNISSASALSTQPNFARYPRAVSRH